MNTSERRFTQTHEWVRLEGVDAVVGLSDHAQHEITDVVYVETAKVGRTVRAGEEVTTLESVKAAFSIYAPLSGTITQANIALEKDPGLVNRSPYDQGWVFQMKATRPEEFQNLMTEAQYLNFVKSGAAASH